MLSKAQIKYIRSLTQQKYRKEYNVFVAEGDKIAGEWLQYGEGVKMIIAVEEWLAAHLNVIARHKDAQVIPVTEEQLASVSQLHTPNKVLLVIETPLLEATPPTNEWVIILDGIQDPGNMGTIIRTADWFGIKHIVCSPDTVEVFNAKVIQSAMGSHLRVKFYVADPGAYISRLSIPVLAAVLNGTSIYEVDPFPAAALLIGNEGKGLKAHLVQAASLKITIPARGGAESLNAAVSAGILCAMLVPRKL